MLTTVHYQLIQIIPALLPTYLLRFPIGPLPTNALECLVAAATLSGLFSRPVRQRWLQGSRQLPRPIIIFTLLFLVSALISTIISPHLLTSLGILKSWIIVPLLYAFLVASAPLPPRRYLRSLLTGALMVALYSFSALGTTTRLQAFYDTPNSLALFLAPLTTLAFFLALQEKRSPFHQRLYFLTSLIL